jgi:hypothetical protein
MFLIVSLAFLLSGVIYNIEPFRTKDSRIRASPPRR